jgi:hypothetical protein
MTRPDRAGYSQVLSSGTTAACYSGRLHVSNHYSNGDLIPQQAVEAGHVGPWTLPG